MTNFRLNHSLNIPAVYKPITLILCGGLAGVSSLWGVGELPSYAQSITSAGDGTGTIVTKEGQRIHISGGSLSSDGRNLFHSFDDFGLEPQAVAEFLSQPNTQNILGRVVGGNVSIIDGLLQVSGSNANLFLMNPAGMIFGPNAQLDVPGSFTATTATGIGFGDQWFQSFGENDYDSLLSDPNQFAFATIQPGSLLNEGNLHVSSGHSLMLLGGTVVNTGQLTAPSGLITLASVPGEQIVRMSHDQMVLSLEFDAIAPHSSVHSPLPFTPLALPDLLAGGAAQNHANTVSVNSDGSLTLSQATNPTDQTLDASFAPSQPGALTTSGTLTTSPDLASPSSASAPLPSNAITLVGDRIATLDATLNADGDQGGGSIRIGGNPRGASGLPTSTHTIVDATTTLSADAIQTGDGGDITVWADATTTVLGQLSATGGQLSGDGGFVEVSANHVNLNTNTVDLTAPHGTFGTLLIDPIDIRIVDGNSGANDGAVVTDNQLLEAEGSGEFVLSAGQLESLTDNADVVLEAKRHIIVEDLASDELQFPATVGSITLTADADLDNVGDFTMDPSDILITNGRDITLSGANLDLGGIDATGVFRGGRIQLNSPGTITAAQSIESFSFGGPNGKIEATAGGNIALDQLITDGGDIILSGANLDLESIEATGLDRGGRIQLDSQGTIAIAQNVESSSAIGAGGNIDITAVGDITLGQNGASESIWVFGATTSGSIQISSQTGAVHADGEISSASFVGQAGHVNISAYDDVILGRGSDQSAIDAFGIDGGGNITIATTVGNIDVSQGSLNSVSVDGPAGRVTLEAGGDISIGTDAFGDGVYSGGSKQQGGDIQLLSHNGDITIAGELDSVSDVGSAGNILVQAAGNVTLGSDALASDASGSAISSTGRQTSGSIRIVSENGVINASAGGLNSFSEQGKAGLVQLEAFDDVVLGADENGLAIASAGRTQGGEITITSQTGVVDASAGTLLNQSDRGTAGTVTIGSFGDVYLGSDLGGWAISSEGRQAGGNIQVTSQTGQIDASAGSLSSASDQGLAGNVTLNAAQDIVFGEDLDGVAIASYGFVKGGNITVNSQNGSIDAQQGTLVSASDGGTAGDIAITAYGSVTLDQNPDVFLSAELDLQGIALASAGVQSGGDITIISQNGAIDVSQGGLGSASLFDPTLVDPALIDPTAELGRAGAVTLDAAGDITVGVNPEGLAIASLGSSQGGDISLTSGGTINVEQGMLTSSSAEGTAGDVSLIAQQNVSIADIVSAGDLAGGTVQITSEQGAIDGSGSAISSISEAGVAGAVTLTAQDDISLGNGNPIQTLNTLNLFPLALEDDGPSSIRSQGLQQGGMVTVTSQQGAIAIDGIIDSISDGGVAGNVSLDAQGGLHLGDRITSAGRTRGGDITLTTATAGLDTRAIALESFSEEGKAGDITLTSQGLLQVGSVDSYGVQRGGDIRLSSETDAIAATQTLNSVSEQGAAGSVFIQAETTVDTVGIESAGFQQGGHIEITSTADAITVAGELNSFSEQGTAGSVQIRTDGNLAAQTIFSEGGLRGGGVHLDGNTVDLSQGFIGSFSELGTAGSVDITAVNDIVLGQSPGGTSISSDGATRGGAVNLNSAEGSIAVEGNILSLAINGEAGNVTVSAQDYVTLGGDINSQSQQRGGDITITSVTQGLDTRTIALQSESGDGTAGDITLSASGTILTGEVDSQGHERGGNITITSDRAITATESLNSLSEAGTAGDVTLTAQDAIEVISIHSAGTERGGGIALTSQTDNIYVEETLESLSLQGDAGRVDVTAAASITSGEIVSHGQQKGGQVNLTSGDRLNVTAINSFSDQGTAGQVTLTAEQDITVGGEDQLSAIRSEGQDKGGRVDVTSRQGAIAINGMIDSISDGGVAGDVTLQARGELSLSDRITSAGHSRGGDITLTTETAGLDTRAIALESFSEQGEAGDITLAAQNHLQVGRVDSFGLQRGGDIQLSSTTSAITVTETLNTGSDQGMAGNVSIKAQTTIDTAAIESAGLVQGGNIDIGTAQDISITGDLNSFSDDGIAGSITIQTDGSLTAQQIFSQGGQQGGGVRLDGDSVDLSQGFIGSLSEMGTAGSVEITAVNDITLGTDSNGTSISSDGATQGGAVTLSSDHGSIDVDGTILSLAINGEAGDVTIRAQDRVSLGGDINSQSQQRGGDITITTATQGLDTRTIALQSESDNGTAGDITLSASGPIFTGDVDSQGQERGGNIMITSDRTITATASLNSLSEAGTAGDVTLMAQDMIAVTNIQSAGTERGGHIALTSQADGIQVADALESLSLQGEAGRVDLSAAGAITSGDIISHGQQKGGQVNLTSGDRLSVTTINSFSDQGTAGQVNLTAVQAINLGGDDQTSAIRSEGQNQGGSVTLTSDANITVRGALDSFSTDGQAGDVTIQAQGRIALSEDIRSEGAQRGGDIAIQTQTRRLDLEAIALESRSSQGRAGNVTLAAPGSITTGAIDSEGQRRGGNITITSDRGAIATTESLNSLSDNGKAGTVTLTAQDDITMAGVFSQGQERGGDILLSSDTGGIEVDGVLASFSEAGQAGTVVLSASQTVDLAGANRTILSRGDQRGGDITITSAQGQINSDGRLVSQSPNGIAGDVTLIANGEIDLQDGIEDIKSIRSRGRTQGGDITLISETAGITTDGALVSISDDGIAGNVTVRAAERLWLDGRTDEATDPNWSVRSLGYEQGGTITLISDGGDVFINGQLISLSPDGMAGDVAVMGHRIIALPLLDQSQAIRSQGRLQGGNVRLISNARQLTIGGDVDSFSPEGIGGSVELSADGAIAIGNLRTFGDVESGDVAIASTQGSITTGNIATIAPNGTSGSVTLQAQLDITTGNVSSTGMESGDINLTSVDGDILTGTVTSSTGTVAVGDDIGSETADVIGSATSSMVTDTREAIAEIEEQREHEFSTYFGRDLTVETMTPEAIHDILASVKQETGNESAIVYISAPYLPPDSLLKGQNKQAAWKEEPSATMGLFENPLELLVFTLEGQPTRITVPGVSRDTLFNTITQFRNQLVLSERRGTHHYLPDAQQLYQWLIAPLEAELGPEAVDTLLFSMDSGLRGLPIAALHDGEQFMVEKYSVGMVPSVGLMDTQYRSLANAEVLAMGAETFTEQNPLPAVPVEVDTITQLRGGTVFLNESFTQDNLTRHQADNPHRIIHLATHAAFNPGTADNSYIQLWGNERLDLNEVQNLGWHNPSVDLLVLSACQTALGNSDAEMGFAGLAVASGVRSALASLWTISDEGTLALMAEFYDQLDDATIKSEALRQSQLAMLNGSIQIEAGELRRGELSRPIALPDGVGERNDRDLSHPYYWSGFTMIGSPW